uniref:Hyaluronidase n=1 Tax=Haemonchus contortus TaxID=6289 RepID=A0A7I5E791_HAECO|nr:Glycoside hydrolase domain containing protein [Haemonchus contortus]
MLIVLTITQLLTMFTQEILSQLDSFPVYWNVPSKVCYSRKVNIPLDQFGITHNKGHEFLGDQIVIFYEYNFGYFPYYADYNPDTPINGGLPQNCPLDKHLARVSKQIREAIPREDFNGIAVIDFEEWRPLYQMNWGKKAVYRRESLRRVRQQYPFISEKSAEEIAKKEFNMAAKKIFLLTIGLARHLRPYARWGFYGFPYCNYDAGMSESDMMCSEKFRRFNDEISFVFESSTALFPSIYLSLKGTSAQNYRYIQAILVESSRIAAMQNPPIDVYPYTKFEYNPYQYLDSFYAKKDVCNSLKQAADLGARGVVLWSSSKNMKQRCEGLAAYVRDMLGPTVALIRKRTQRCREKRCSGHGQCVLPSPASRCTFRMQPESYICRCDTLYTGGTCNVRRHFQSNSDRKESEVVGYRTARKSGRRWLGRRRRIRIMKVIGDTATVDSSSSGGVHEGMVTAAPIKPDDTRQLELKEQDSVNVTDTSILVATAAPETVSTSDTFLHFTPPPLDFRLI